MLTELQKRKLTKLFSMYDRNCDGILAYQDFEKIVEKLADLRNWSSRSSKYLILSNKFSERWQGLQAKADKSRDKKVSLEEWLNYYEEVLSDEQRYRQTIQEFVEVLFEAFDKDSDGKISQPEWADLLCVYNVSSVYAPSIFPKLDTNGDGFLSKEELVQLIREFYYSNEPNAVANSMFGPY